MKKYDLSISLPYFRTLDQQTVLDALLKDERFLSYSRTLTFSPHEDSAAEEYIIQFAVKD